MIWSISGARQFEQCRRQWYYKNIVANAHIQHDGYRQEMVVLAKVKTLDAWRGTIVDSILSRRVIHGIRNKYPLNKNYYISEALKEFETQFQFAEEQRYRVDGFKFSSEEDFAALFPFEFASAILDEEIKRLKEDIVNAITKFVEDEELIARLKSAQLLVAQRPLVYKFNKFTVRGVPDLIAFYQNEPPHIFDWKVHTYGIKAYDKQLISYAIALFKVVTSKPHKDFPSNLTTFDLCQYRVSEYQLLQNVSKREYELTEESLEEVEDYISSSILSIYMSGGCKDYSELVPAMFETAFFSENNCPNCSFKNYCKLDEKVIRNRCLSDSKPSKTNGQLSLM